MQIRAYIHIFKGEIDEGIDQFKKVLKFAEQNLQVSCLILLKFLE
jgi:hypothetical protein